MEYATKENVKLFCETHGLRFAYTLRRSDKDTAGGLLVVKHFRRYFSIGGIDAIPDSTWRQLVAMLSPICNGEWTVYAA